MVTGTRAQNGESRDSALGSPFNSIIVRLDLKLFLAGAAAGRGKK